jgi:hypothetical protein
MCNVSKRKYIETLLENCGFFELMPGIVEDIEDELAGTYNAVEDDGDVSYAATYGGVIYHSERLIAEGNFVYRLKKGLSDNQKKIFKNLVNDDDFEVGVERTDYKQKWAFRIQPEISPNSNERFDIDVEMTVSVLNPKKYEIEATESSEDGKINYSELLFITNLSI